MVLLRSKRPYLVCGGAPDAHINELHRIRYFHILPYDAAAAASRGVRVSWYRQTRQRRECLDEGRSRQLTGGYAQHALR